MTETLRDPSRITAGWLTDRLRARGWLADVRVKTVEFGSSYRTTPSILTPLRLTYSGDAGAAAPERLLLKIPRRQFLPVDDREVVFYDSVAPGLSPSPAVRCLDAAHDRETGSCHLLLEDLSATHLQLGWLETPEPAHARGIVDALALLHAQCWEGPRAVALSALPEEELHSELGGVDRRFPRFVARTSEALSPAVREIFERVLEAWPNRFGRRISGGRAVTLIHADAHNRNLLLPRRPAADRVCLIDLQAFRPWLGVQDLAYNLTLFWHPDERRRQEVDLLKRYHDRLAELGIEDYPWEDLWYDYRLSVMTCLHVPWIHGGDPGSAWLWRPQLERAMNAFRDLKCFELLPGP